MEKKKNQNVVNFIHKNAPLKNSLCFMYRDHGFVNDFFPNNRNTQRESFTTGVGPPFSRYKYSGLLVRFKGLFLKAKKNVLVQIRQLNLSARPNC